MTRAWLDIDGLVHEIKLPAHGGAAVGMIGVPCACGSTGIIGGNMQREGHDGYRADGYCVSCKSGRGVIHARVATIFGVEEDEAVLNGRPRVY